jgi:hypothetical protein
MTPPAALTPEVVAELEAALESERDALRARVAELATLRTAHDYMREQAGQCCAWTVAVGCHECAWMRGLVRRLDAALAPKEKP